MAAPRRFGKTTLIKTLAAELRTRDWIVCALAAGTAGHPQRAAMVAHFLWQQPRLDEAGVRAAEAEALHSASGELEQLWLGLTRAQRQVIGSVADGRTELLSMSTLAAMGLGKSTAQQARDVLEAEGR